MKRGITGTIAIVFLFSLFVSAVLIVQSGFAQDQTTFRQFLLLTKLTEKEQENLSEWRTSEKLTDVLTKNQVETKYSISEEEMKTIQNTCEAGALSLGIDRLKNSLKSLKELNIGYVRAERSISSGNIDVYGIYGDKDRFLVSFQKLPNEEVPYLRVDETFRINRIYANGKNVYAVCEVLQTKLIDQNSPAPVSDSYPADDVLGVLKEIESDKLTFAIDYAMWRACLSEEIGVLLYRKTSTTIPTEVPNPWE